MATFKSMRAIAPDRRLFLLLLAAGSIAAADPKQETASLIATMASALSDANTEGFLRAVDLSSPGYERFASDIRALSTQNQVSNVIEIGAQKGDDRAQEIEIGWEMEIKGIGQSDVSVRREATVRLKLERRNKKWLVVSLDPMSFFSPPATAAGR